MNTLLIHHVTGSDPPAFEVHHLLDSSKHAKAAPILPPAGFPVEGLPDSDLVRELRWYLEDFLDYPFPPATDRADRVQAALKQWGAQAFQALFDNRQAGAWYEGAAASGLENFQLQVSSDDPRILAWPWEALHDPLRGFVALGCHLERRLSAVADPLSLPEGLPKDRVNILLVVARPFERDVGFRSISRPLVDLIAAKGLPAEVTLLRPPTFDRLRDHLRERPGYYHILHFDGHGAYGVEAPGGGASPFRLQAAPQGHLAFETDDGKPFLVSAATLSDLLREHRLPAVVLNACQSATLDHRAEDAFASVAASLIRAGIHSVVAMAYSIYVSGAQKFLPAFYRRLFDSGDLAQAARAGRQQMFQDKGRVCARGTHPLEDWIVPVVYQQEPMDFSFAPEARQAAPKRPAPALPPEARDAENPYGFIGRDGPILALERAMRRPPAGILIHGLGGVGKTTLARGFLHWLSQTGGLGGGCFWFTFNDIHSAEFVLNGMGTALFGPDFITAPPDRKIEALAAAFRRQPFLIIWDNFESASGVENAGMSPMLSEADRELLRTFLEHLRGGPTKVLITSRSEEDWLRPTNRFVLGLGGLTGEERWEFCRVILRDLGMDADRGDPALVALMDALDGHPLLMRAVLPELRDRSAASILKALQGNLAELGAEDDPARRKVAATLRFVEDRLPEDLRPLLVPLSLHERFADADYLEEMAKQVDAKWTRPKIEALLAVLGVAGLVRDRGQAIYELHPALTGFLRTARAADPSRDKWVRAFVDVMGSVADALAPRPLHEQRFGFQCHRANFHYALGEAERLDMHRDFAALVQSLAAYAQNTRDFAAAERLYARLAESRYALGDAEVQAAAYHQLGLVAQERRDVDGAGKWYLKSLAIKERLGDEAGAASTYHQLGRIAEERRDFDGAEKWYLKSLAIKEKLGNEAGAALTYHQLGMVAQERRHWGGAEKWYLKSLAISERLDIHECEASTYHQLGVVALLRRDFDGAEKWYLKALAIKEKLGDEAGAASTYHQLGMVSQERRDFDGAEKWYLKSLAISERLGIEAGAATTYHQLGRVAHARRDLSGAEKWYLKSLAIEDEHHNTHGAAISYGQLGLLAAERGQSVHAGRWLIKSIQAFRATRDPHSAEKADQVFLLVYSQTQPRDQAALKALWTEAGLGEFPSPPDA